MICNGVHVGEVGQVWDPIEIIGAINFNYARKIGKEIKIINPKTVF